MSVYSATAKCTSISPGTSHLVVNGETLTTNQASDRVNVALPYGREAGSISVCIDFSGDPGAFTLDVQEADIDSDSNYVNVPVGGTVTAVTSGFRARVDLAPFTARFCRVFQTLQTANAVTANVRIVCH